MRADLGLELEIDAPALVGDAEPVGVATRENRAARMKAAAARYARRVGSLAGEVVAPEDLAPGRGSGARWFVGDLGRSGVNQHEGLGQLSLGHGSEGDQLRKLGDGNDVAAGSADRALVSRVGQLLARLVGGLLRLDIACMAVLGMIMSRASNAAARGQMRLG